MSATKKRALVSAILNALIIPMAILPILAVAEYNPAQLSFGIRLRNTMIYFTTLSNLYLGINGLIQLPYAIRSFRSGKDCVPRFAFLLKLTSVVAVTLTMLTVLVWLGPVLGFASQLGGPTLYLHLLTPLVGLISFLWFDGGSKLGKRHIITGMIPLLIYAPIYLIEVVFIGAKNGG
ncbi:MAG: hypothetical protein MJ099_06995, partial [Clostridia bacterium]|nr:hypothetical protein [Clostridia bacterium]